MTEFTSTVTMSLDEYNEIMYKVNAYEEIINVMTTPAELDDWDKNYHASVDEGYRIKLSTSNVLPKLSRRAKKIFNAKVKENMKDYFYLSLGEYEQSSISVDLGTVTRKRTTEETDVSPEGMNDRE